MQNLLIFILQRYPKPIILNGLSYIRDPEHFRKKKQILGSVSINVILVTADVVGLYPNISHQAGLKALKEALEKKDI